MVELKLILLCCVDLFVVCCGICGVCVWDLWCVVCGGVCVVML